MYAQTNSVLMTLGGVYHWRGDSDLLLVLSKRKHYRTKDTHSLTYRWWCSVNCPSHSSPCILTVRPFSQADVIVKLFLKRDTIEKADSCSMARVLPLIPNRGPLFICRLEERRKTLLPAFPTTTAPAPFRSDYVHLHTQTQVDTYM